MTTETKHTGKWTVKRHKEDYGYGYGKTDIFVDIGGDELIKIGTHDSPKNAYYEDVARLMSLCPELLEALEEVMMLPAHSRKCCRYDLATSLKKYEQLIARTRGGKNDT